MDSYEDTLSTAERDRRERVANDVCSLLTLASAHSRAAFLMAKHIKADHPLSDAAEEYAAAMEAAESDLIDACRAAEGGRYQYIEAQRNAGVAAMDDLGRLLLGEKR